MKDTIKSSEIQWVPNWEIFRDFCNSFWRCLVSDQKTEAEFCKWGIMLMPVILEEAIKNDFLPGWTVEERVKKIKINMVDALINDRMPHTAMIIKDQERWDRLNDDEVIIVYDDFYHTYLPTNAEAVLREALTEGEKYMALRESFNSSNSKEARNLLWKIFQTCDLPITHGNWRNYL